MALTLLPGAAFAKNSEELPGQAELNRNSDSSYAPTTGVCGADGNNLTWTFDSGLLTISGAGAMEDYVSSSPPWQSYRLDIKTIAIKDGVTSIGSGAFDSCSSLTNVTIPNSVTSIGDGTFESCYSLVNVIIPNGVVSIGNWSFTNCISLASMTIPNSVMSIGKDAFSGCKALTNMTIANSVISIGDSAFYGCKGLTSVTIPNSVTSIGDTAFYDCSGLTSVTISNRISSIGNEVFCGCSGLTSVTIPNSVISIGDSAFCGCSGLTSVTIPNSVTSIGMGAFAKCSDLMSVTIPDSVTSIGSGAFDSCSSLTNVTIPNSVTSIDSGLFQACSGLTSIKIPNSVTSIGDTAFLGCSGLTSVTIPDSVTSISYNAFYGCSGLTGITIPSRITSIDNGTFCGCSGLTSVIIPSSVINIAQSAFYGCSGLTSVTIPNSVTAISYDAFTGCTALTDIYYMGSKDQWDSISINSGNDYLLNSIIHYNSTGPDDPSPTPGSNSARVEFLRVYDSATRSVAFGSDEVSPYSMSATADVSSIDQLVGKYVLVTINPDSVLEVTSIASVESKIGTVTASGDHSLTIDGTTYPVQEDLILSVPDGQEVLYHLYNGTIVGFSRLERKTGTLEAWDSVTGKATIDGKAYPTNYMTNLSFSDKISQYLNHSIIYFTAGSQSYEPLIKIEGIADPDSPEDFNATIYHAKWLSKGGTDADILKDKTPSEIIVEQLNASGGDLGIDMWRSFELVFNTLDDINTLHDFAVKPKDIYSALILNALEASVSVDVIDKEAENGVKLCGALISDISNALKINYKIDLNNDDQFQDIIHRMVDPTTGKPIDVDKYMETFASDWFKKKQPDLGSLSKSFSWFSKGFKLVGTVEDFTEYCVECYTLSQISDSMESVLELAYQKSKSIYGANDNLTLAFKECLDMITRSADELFEQIEKEAATVVGSDGLKYIVNDLLWAKVTDHIKVACPEISALQLTYKVAKTVTDKLLHTSDTAELYLKMEYVSDIESLMESVYRDLEDSFDKEPTLQNAAAYLCGMEFSFQLRDVDCKTAYDYVDVLRKADENLQGSIIGAINSIFGSHDYESLKNTIKSFRNIYKEHYIGAERNWVACLAEDYPGTGLYEKYDALLGSTDDLKLIKEIIASCPINVYVYDQSNNLVASIIEGRVSCKADDVMVALLGDQKVVRLYDGADYRVEYVGYDAGDMDIAVTEFDGNEQIARTVNYYDVPLTNGKTYSMAVDDETLKPYTLSDQTDHSTVDHDYDSMNTSTAHTIKVISGTLQRDGDLFVQTTASKGEALELTAYVPEGYEFIRWEASSESALIKDALARITTILMPDEDIIVTAIMKGNQNPSKTYTITFAPNGGTVDITTKKTETDGKLSSLPTPTRSGYSFDGWYTESNGGAKISTSYIFSADTTIYAHWTYIGSSSGDSNSGGGNDSSDSSNNGYSVSIGSASHGKVTASPSRASKGEKVTLTIKPDSGYKLDILVIEDNKGNKLDVTKVNDTRYTFIMPSGKVTITPTFTKVEQSNPANRFVDVPADAYYANAVAWAVENGITSGTSATTFSPDTTCTRAQMVTFLWRAAGSPTPKGTSHPFTDINPGAYYYDAVLWAMEQGITAGTSATTFGPNDTVTRGQTVTFLHRAAGSPSAKNETSFADVDGNAYYANAVQWAAEQNITAGTSATTFSPGSGCTRAQIVTFLYRANN